jgi:hypothetical protein
MTNLKRAVARIRVPRIDPIRALPFKPMAKGSPVSTFPCCDGEIARFAPNAEATRQEFFKTCPECGRQYRVRLAMLRKVTKYILHEVTWFFTGRYDADVKLGVGGGRWARLPHGSVAAKAQLAAALADGQEFNWGAK